MVEKLAAAERDKLGKSIVEGLYRSRMILTWYRDKPEGWILANGDWSPYYIKMKTISSSREDMLYVNAGRAMCALMDDMGFKKNGRHKIVGVAWGGIPLANAVTYRSGIPSLFTRKPPDDVKTDEQIEQYLASHGQHALIEGELESGDVLAVMDDVVTSFESCLLARRLIRKEAEKRKLRDVTAMFAAALMDREQGAAEKAASMGIELRTFIPFISKGIAWLRDELTGKEYDTITDYQKDPKKYQDQWLQKLLMRQSIAQTAQDYRSSGA